MDHTAHLDLPYLMAAQAQKHVTHNEALRMLDALVQLAVASRSNAEPPASPTNGERHIVASAATGAWTGWDGAIACFVDGGWLRFTPRDGWLAWAADESLQLVHAGGAWRPALDGATLALDGIGIRTTADADNRLAVKSDGAVFSHDDVTPGSGDMRITVNRNTGANDAGFVFETAWASRALFGLLGSDDFEIKVSPDGAPFVSALSLDSATGAATLRAVLPAVDNALPLGAAARRWSVVHAATGTISTSDARQKTDIAPLPVGLDFLRALHPVRYRFHDGSRPHFGLIAQQVKAAMDAHDIADFAGWTLADAADPTSEQGLRYEEFVAVLVSAVQDLAAQVETLRRTAE